MPRMRRNKSSPTSATVASAIKEITSQQATYRARLIKVNTFKLTLHDQATIEQILAEIKSVAARVSDMDESVGTRLDTIDGALKEI